jgi:hypothetical protein
LFVDYPSDSVEEMMVLHVSGQLEDAGDPNQVSLPRSGRVVHLKLGQTIRSHDITRGNMALPLPPGLTPPEIAFLCEMELVTVIPRQRLEGLELLGVGLPLQTPRPDNSYTRIVYNLVVLMIIRGP